MDIYILVTKCPVLILREILVDCRNLQFLYQAVLLRLEKIHEKWLVSGWILLNAPQISDKHLIIPWNIVESSSPEKVLTVCIGVGADGCKEPALGIPLAAVNSGDAKLAEV